MPVSDEPHFLRWIKHVIKHKEPYNLLKLGIAGDTIDILDKLQQIKRATSFEELRDKELLVIGEYGYGDHILLYRYLLRLKNICNLTLICPKQIQILLQEVYTITTFPEDLSKFDCYIWLFDLLWLMDDVGSTSKYLSIPYEKFLPDKKDNIIRIGFALGNNDTISDMTYRNMDNTIMNYFMQESIETYNFSDIFSVFCTDNLFLKFSSFIDTCRYIQEMDFMITSDNCILHLSGALEKRTYSLFSGIVEPIWFSLPERIEWYDSITPILVHPMSTSKDIAELIRDLEGL